MAVVYRHQLGSPARDPTLVEKSHAGMLILLQHGHLPPHVVPQWKLYQHIQRYTRNSQVPLVPWHQCVIVVCLTGIMNTYISIVNLLQ